MGTIIKKINVTNDGGGYNMGGTQYVFRPDRDRVFVLCFDFSSGDLKMFMSSKGGAFAESDSGSRPSNANNKTCSADIDSTGVIHIVYYRSGSGSFYATFDTSNNTWDTTAELINSTESTTPNNFICSIAVDSNDKPHVVWGGNLSSRGTTHVVFYSQRVSGSWSAVSVLSSSSAVSTFSWCEIIIDENNLPNVCSQSINNVNSTGQLIAYRGTTNTPVIFNSFSIDTAVFKQQPSIAEDSNGDIYVAWVESGATKIRKHISGNSWSVWSSEVTITTSASNILGVSLIAVGSEPSIYAVIRDASLDMELSYATDFGDYVTGEFSQIELVEGTANFTKFSKSSYNQIDRRELLEFCWAEGNDIFFGQYPIRELDLAHNF